MKLKYNNLLWAFLFIFLFLNGSFSFAQTCDTLSNWDGISQNWVLYGQSAEVVANPLPGSVNPSAHCYSVVTTENQWDNISYELTEPMNFDSYHHFRVKVLAPGTGGSVTFKFQNQDNSEWQEITQTPVPGQWSDLEFDFSGLYYNNLTTLVIFYDFQGTTPGIEWYIDDVIKMIPDPQPVESNLPIVVIDTYNVWIPDAYKIDASMGIIDNGEGQMNHLADPFNGFYGRIGIETRGHSSQMFPKKSFGVETRNSLGEDLDVSLLGMPAESDWILYGPYTDKSMLRDVFSFEMNHKMNDIYSSRTKYVELVVNGDYRGVYVLLEKIKKGENRVDIGTLKPDEVSGEDVTGGYILAVDWRPNDFVYNHDGWKSEVSPPYNNTIKPTFQYFYPERDEIVDPQRYYIKSFVTSAETALVSPSFGNPYTGYIKYFDVPSFVDFMIMAELSKEVDKYRLSQYFYKEKDKAGGKLYAGPVWDFNLGYGNVDYWTLGLGYTGFVYNDIQTWDYSIMYWWKRLMEDPYFRNLAKTRWEGLRSSCFSNTSINTTIDSLTNVLSAAKNRNYERWTILGTYVWPNHDWQNNTYEDEVDYFRNFVIRRANWLDSNLPGTPINPAVNISAQGNTISLVLLGDYFRNNDLKTHQFVINDAPISIVLESVEYINAAECKLTFNNVVTGALQISVTVLEEAVNTWQDITSNRLETAGFEDTRNGNAISLISADNRLIIRCNKPETLPADARIISMNGSVVGEYTLQHDSENTIYHQLKPGVYMLVLQSAEYNKAYKFVVIN
ncbi:MAG: CotH kinase family protein [Chloroflexota bacterium]